MTVRPALVGAGLLADHRPDGVIRGEETPLVPAREALENLRVIDAARRSAATGTTITLNPIPAPEGDTP
ncbi:Gfo/Idh/MocA family oxidoreductase [Albidovulum sediminis]|uniref:Gfo/Idh/MocA-like oxidoreductase C-terminal domain-containing protein n=1 Tax=Albidovulum sediminis TaxID=3066345 RepID=A0ABT2NNR6_9RHOB|nr:Gfo/Idh/MocA family oxidoreductase [Defluviimonas sediminis]MCT8330534.1 hypothetical protein [Defluviimonas sediminis]